MSENSGETQEVKPCTNAHEIRYCAKNCPVPPERGLVWNYQSELWETKEEHAQELERRRAFRQIVGDEYEVAALNDYEKGMGL